MKILENETLAKYTAFGVGGPADKLVILGSAKEVLDFKRKQGEKYWVLGYGTNCVISDEGLPGVVFMLRGGPEPKLDGNYLVIDAATNWDRAVEFAIRNNLWGVELMSGIPGNTGAALSGNIAAYGQAVVDTFAWAKVYDPITGKVNKLTKGEIKFSYRHTSLQDKQKDLIILEVALKLSDNPTKELAYASALKTADSLGLSPDTLDNRRKIILETRLRAGSIYDDTNPDQEKTAGSFFKNPIVNEATAKHLAGFEEFGKTVEELLEQNRIHGGDEFRVSASHVLLAAGFERGQAWNSVRLHPKHILKIENTGEATAGQIYDAAQEILSTVRQRMGINLEPEVQFIGHF